VEELGVRGGGGARLERRFLKKGVMAPVVRVKSDQWGKGALRGGFTGDPVMVNGENWRDSTRAERTVRPGGIPGG